jgi:MFS family permease
MGEILRHKNWTLIWIYLANLLLSLHYYLVIYINSSYLEQFFDKKGIALLYTASSIINILIFLETPKILKRYGNWHFVTTAVVIEFLTTLGMAFADTMFTAGWLFVLHLTLVALILFSLDVFLEQTTKEESVTGELRSVYLTLSNLALVISPAIVGIIGNTNFSNVYILSALITIPLFFVAYFKLHVPDAQIDQVSMKETLKDIHRADDVRNITIAQLSLQFFYAWMVVYMPIYLNEVIGFSWTELGPLFSIMLLPFVLFEVPIGWLSDRGYGERIFMLTGFVLMGIAIFCVPFVTTRSFVTWAIILFISRMGASFVEITTESYFFKHVNGRNASVISLFRIMRPLSFILMPIVFMLSLNLMSFKASFFVLAIIIFLSIYFAKKVHEAKDELQTKNPA